LSLSICAPAAWDGTEQPVNGTSRANSLSSHSPEAKAFYLALGFAASPLEPMTHGEFG
jgi:hypothetical protein